jgi:TonB family protein
METVVPELQLLTEWGDPDDGPRKRRAVIATILFHVGVVLVLALLPPSLFVTPPVKEEVHHITPIYLPLTELTQRAKNKGKVTKEFEARSEQPQPRTPPPAPPPPAPKPQIRQAVLPPPPSAPKPQPVAPLPEAPKVDLAIKPPPKIDAQLPQLAAPPPPKIQEAEAPKNPFEKIPETPAPVAPGRGLIPIPDTSAEGAIHDVVRGLSSHTVVGDSNAMGTPGIGGLNQPSGGVQGAALELKSDPTGVDFKPYLEKVLAAVKRNWQAVMPQSVRLGRRGKVICEFRILRDGTVQKIVFAEQSGSDPLDRAAVAGISASVPFPPLPIEFKGDNIVLRLNFVYNAPRR